jgi:hypothetical protein
MFECDNEDNVGGEDLDAKILVCYIHKKGIKLDVVLKMIFYEMYYGGSASHVPEYFFEIDGIKIDVILI